MFNISQESVNSGLNRAVSNSISLAGMMITGTLLYGVTKIPQGIRFISGNVKSMFSSKTTTANNRVVKKAAKRTAKRVVKKDNPGSK